MSEAADFEIGIECGADGSFEVGMALRGKIGPVRGRHPIAGVENRCSELVDSRGMPTIKSVRCKASSIA